MTMDISKCSWVIIRDDSGKIIDKFEIDSITILEFLDGKEAVEFKKIKKQ
jgi:hypothetical protein